MPDGLFWVPSLVVFGGAAIALVAGLVGLRRLGVRREVRDTDAARAVETAAKARLVRADEAVRDAEQEVRFAEAQFGAEAARELAATVVRARGWLREAFLLQQRLDEGEQATLLEVESGKELPRIRRVSAGSIPPALSRSGHRLLGMTSEDSLRVWSLPDGKVVFHHSFQGTNVTALALTPDGSHLAVGTSDGWIFVWRIDNKQEMRRLMSGAPAARLAFSPDGRMLAEAAPGETIKVKWQLPGGTIYDSRSPHYRDLLDNYYIAEKHFDAPYSTTEIVTAGEGRWVFRR